MDTMSSFKRWLVMACLGMSGGLIYLLPFLREVYYLPLQKALHLSNTQLGVLMSVFGAASLITYFPGGWLADRYSPRKLMTFSLLMTGFAGLYFASFPSYQMSIIVHAFWGVTTGLTFWASMIKATRNWAPSTEQGRAFGILETVRGIGEMATSTIFLAVFAKLGGGDRGLSWVIIVFSLVNILLGVMTWLVISDASREDSGRELKKEKVGLRDIFRVLKMPVVWLISAVIIAAYSAYWGSYYFTPYATDVFKMSVVFGGAIGVGKMYLKPPSALAAGFFADRAGISRAVSLCFLILIGGFAVFILTPGSPRLVAILIANTAITSLAIFALRGISFALLEEGGVPLAVTGTATGIVSVVGFTPDVFMPMVGGVLLDRYPGAPGYRLLFLFIAVLCLGGLFSAIIIQRKYAHRKLRISQNLT